MVDRPHDARAPRRPPRARAALAGMALGAAAIALLGTGLAGCDQNPPAANPKEDRLESLEDRLVRLEGLLLEAAADRLRGGAPASPSGPLPSRPEWSEAQRSIHEKAKRTGLHAARLDDVTGLEGRSLVHRRFLDANGEVFDLGSLRGRRALVVVLRGYAARVCIFCAHQTFELSDQAAAFRERGVDVVLVYPGRAGTAPLFLDALERLERRGMPPPFPVLLDVDLRLVDELGIRGNLAKPTTLLLDANGTITWAYVGVAPDDRPGIDQLLEVLDRPSASGQ